MKCGRNTDQLVYFPHFPKKITLNQSWWKFMWNTMWDGYLATLVWLHIPDVRHDTALWFSLERLQRNKRLHTFAANHHHSNLSPLFLGEKEWPLDKCTIFDTNLPDPPFSQLQRLRQSPGSKNRQSLEWSPPPVFNRTSLTTSSITFHFI